MFKFRWSKSPGPKAEEKDEADKWDLLGLKQNRDLNEFFEEKEYLILSAKVVKINDRGKGQKRVILVSNKAIYNMVSGKYKSYKRKIPLDKVSYIVVADATMSDIESPSASRPSRSKSTKNSKTVEFVVKVPSEYDYRFIYQGDLELVHEIARICQDITGQPVPVKAVNSDDLANLKMAKSVPRLKHDDAKTDEEKDEEPTLSRRSANQVSSPKSKNWLPRALSLSADERPDMLVSSSPNPKVVFALDNSIERASFSEPYEQLELLSKSNYGTIVAKVMRKDNQSIWTMKIILKEKVIENQLLDDIANEKSVIGSLNHPYICTIQEMFEDDNYFGSLWPFYAGGTLSYQLRKLGPLDADTVRFVISEVALALFYLHMKNIIHRDLSIENIFVDDAGHVYLGGLGFARTLQRGDRLFEFTSSFENAPPEVFKFTGYDYSCDFWMLGIVTYSLLTGRHPFQRPGASSVQTVHSIQNNQLEFPAKLDIPADAKKFCMSLLNKDASKRHGYSSQGESGFVDLFKDPFLGPLTSIPNWMSKSVKPIWAPKVFDASLLSKRASGKMLKTDYSK